MKTENRKSLADVFVTISDPRQAGAKIDWHALDVRLACGAGWRLSAGAEKRPDLMALGFTWLATVPPTAGIVGKLFGIRYLATLFGLTVLSHQIGGFFGAWLGGLAITSMGNYDLMWYADMALASAAALVNLPIRETRIRPILQPS